MIKQPIYAIMSVVLLLAVFYFIANRLVFLHSAQRTTGTITSIQTRNDRCGSRRSHYNCTKFSAIVTYSANESGAGLGQKYTLRLSAGSVHGWDHSAGEANRYVNQSVTVVYSPRNPSESYEDTVFGVWGTPLMTLLFQVCTFIASLTEPSNRRRQQRGYS